MGIPGSDAHLSQACLLELRRTLSADISCEVSLDDADEFPSGATDYCVSLQVQWFRELGRLEIVGQDHALLLDAAKEQGARLEDEAVTLTVGYAHLLVVDVYDPEVWNALDAREADLGALGSTLFSASDVREHEYESMLLPALAERIELVYGHAILINSLVIDPLFQGVGLGQRGMTLAIRELRRGCSFAALHAIGPGIQSDAERTASHRRLSKYWSRLGFEAFQDEVMVLSLVHNTFDHAMLELAAGEDS